MKIDWRHEKEGPDSIHGANGRTKEGAVKGEPACQLAVAVNENKSTVLNAKFDNLESESSVGAH